MSYSIVMQTPQYQMDSLNSLKNLPISAPGGATQTLGAGGLARVDPSTVRRLRNTSDTADAMYFCVGGDGGYVGRDGENLD